MREREKETERVVENIGGKTQPRARSWPTFIQGQHSSGPRFLMYETRGLH